MTTELNNCPFCGSDKVDVAHRAKGSYLTVRCDKCQAEGPLSINREYAIEWWNRALQSPQT